MRRDNHSLAHVVVVIECRWECLVHSHDGLWIDLPSRSPRRPPAIREDFVGAITRPPRNGCESPDEPPSVFVGSQDTAPSGAGLRQSFGHYPADGLPIETRSRRGFQDHESWISRWVVESRPTLYKPCHAIDDRRHVSRTRSPPIGNDGLLPNQSDDGRRTTSVPHSNADGPVSTSLPGDVGIEPNEPRISDQVQVLRQVADDLRREERRAHPLQAVRVINADPEDHGDLQTSAEAKIRAPAKLQIASVRSMTRIDADQDVRVLQRGWPPLREADGSLAEPEGGPQQHRHPDLRARGPSGLGRLPLHGELPCLRGGRRPHPDRREPPLGRRREGPRQELVRRWSDAARGCPGDSYGDHVELHPGSRHPRAGPPAPASRPDPSGERPAATAQARERALPRDRLIT